ncbi:competence protein CoiA family protein [uncultured Clostridium sp.]|uniref:competence protein CoiA family protein n=1 Tax=uncultured Clostridium sp. TaxID=59620 RepID=UPI0032167D02
MFENINLWFAKDENDEIITIDKINEENKHNTYTCPICGGEVIARTGDIKIHHFAHKDKSKCSSESMIHFWVKNELIKVGETFKIKLDNVIKEYVCRKVLIEKSYETKFGVYKPDITILTESDEIIYFEVAKTNKKRISEYFDIWNELNNIIVEVETKDLINVSYIKEFKAISYKNIDSSIKSKILNVMTSNNTKEKCDNYLNSIIWIINDIKNMNFNIQENKDYIFYILDLVIDERLIYRSTLMTILNSKCISIKDEYINHRLNLINIECKELIENANNIIKSYKGSKFYYLECGLYYKSKVIKIKDRNMNYGKFCKPHIIYFYNSIKDIKSEINNIIKSEMNTLNCYNRERRIKQYEKYVENNIKEYLMKISENYNCHINNYTNSHVLVWFNHNNVLQINITNINMKTNVNDLCHYIKTNIYNYRKSLIILENIKDMENTYNYIDNILNQISPIKYTYITRKSSWHPRVNYATHKYCCTGKLISEDKYQITIKMLNNDMVIRFSNDIISFSNSVNIKIENINNISSYNKKIMKIISDEIRKERYKNN